MPVRTLKGILRLFYALGSAVFPLCTDTHSQALEKAIEALVDSGKVLGAQVILAEKDQILLERNFGVRSALDSTPVDSDTKFCIGSCSKPFASATLFVLAQNKQVNLDTPIDRWIPGFSEIDLSNRAPTLRELLAHRGGIYSQKLGMNQRQSRLIRDFRLTLEDAVNGIAKEELIFEPGTDHAYSGAGYCVLGRVAEVASDLSFETLFQRSIGQPLALKRTTYFPNPDDSNIATGSAKGKPNPNTPHLSKPFHLPLIGGSLYSTALDTSRFARMVLERGRFGNRTILEPDTYRDYLSLPFEGKAYGMGWSVKQENNRPVEISHTGALASSRASIRINLDTGRYVIVFYTLTDPSVSVETARAVNRGIIEALRE